MKKETKMQKTLLTTLMAGTMALTLSALFSVPAMAACPVKAQTPCAKKCDKPAPPMECKKTMSPEERAKMREARKADFEARLQLTESQKAQLEKIKADEKKALAPYKEKIAKERAKMNELFEKERAIIKYPTNAEENGSPSCPPAAKSTNNDNNGRYPKAYRQDKKALP